MKKASCAFILFLLLAMTSSNNANAFPEYQAWSQKHSKRTVDCAMCHVHGDGPEGSKPGQMDTLDADAQKRLEVARGAEKPGVHADNPILNEFGNYIVFKLGLEQVYKMRDDPSQLKQALGEESDHDGDGISDGEEFEDGTHPLNNQSGAPWKLFIQNLQKKWVMVAIILFVAITSLFGFKHLLRYSSKVD
ncbi:MAG: hypothetical protein HQK50_08615 [Oligoflexia bacterium]|nr:hypothetical protein [Oligoflexia bacterium]